MCLSNLAVAMTDYAARSALGHAGECLAAEHLSRNGYVILSRNWRCREGELDIVATVAGVLVFCEVKTRSGRGYGTPAEAVTEAKAARIRRLALRWIRSQRLGWCPLRFDVIAVDWPPGGAGSVRHIEGAF